MTSFIYLKGNCPVCLGTRKDCRQMDELFFCRGDNPSPSFVFKKHDVHGFGIFVEKALQDEQDSAKREEYRRERELEKQQQLTEEATRRAKSLSEEERDREIRNILSQLSLNQKHRGDLMRRGLSQEAIERGMFRSVEAWQKLDRPISSQLAGVNIDGRSLTNGQPGFICPVWNASGLIVGWQLRLDNADESGKYRWPSSRGKKRPNGPTAHLPNGELPITVCRPRRQNSQPLSINLAEGILKPKIAAELHSQIFLGAAGGNFASSPETFKSELDKIASEIEKNLVILHPDGGAVSNPHVMRIYAENHKLVSGWGYQFQVAWWGQFTKNDPDIDELLAAGRGDEIQIITWQEFLEIASDFLPEKAQSWQSSAAKNSTISHQEWYEKFKLPEHFQELSQFIRYTYNRVAWKHWKRTGKLPEKAQKHPRLLAEVERKKQNALVLYRPESITISPGNIPSEEEWIKMGCPRMEWEGESGISKQIYQEFYQNWENPKLWNSTLMGGGKSHEIGNLKGKDFAFTVSGKNGDRKTITPRIFYTDINHRNPSTATIEQHYADQESRSDGWVIDYNRRTELDNPFIVRPKAGEKGTLEGNCPETQTFLLLNGEKNLPIRGGKGSPICENCQHYRDSEGKVSCSFILDRTFTLQKTEIRQHPDQSIPAKEGDIYIVEEASQSLSPARSFTVSAKDIAYSYQELQTRNPQLAWLIEPIFKALYPLLDINDLPRYGLDFKKLQQQLPAKEELRSRCWEVFWLEWLETDDAWTDDIPSLEGIGPLIRKTLLPDLGKLFKQAPSPEQKQRIIKDCVPIDWISPVWEALVEGKRYLQINEHGLQISQRNRRLLSLLSDYKMVVFLDSTATKLDLSRLSGISQKDIVEIRQKPPSFHNLHIHLIRGVGRCGRSRRQDSSFSEQERIQAAVRAIAKHHPDSPIGLADHQLFVERYDDLPNLKGTYWFGSGTRGSNEFKGCEVLVSVGSPVKNLGMMAAHYFCLSGQVVSPDGFGGSYGAWVNRMATAEIAQWIGRQRAHHYPHRQFHSYILGADQISASAIAQFFPGAIVQEMDIYDFCPEAAPKGVQRDGQLWEVLAEFIRQGQDPCTEDVGERLGIHRTRISQLLSQATRGLKLFSGRAFEATKRLLILLFNTLNNKTNTPPTELSDDERWVVESYFPELWRQYQEATNQAGEEQAAVEVVREILLVADSFGTQRFEAILAETPIDNSLQMAKILLNLLTPGIDWSPPFLEMNGG